MLSSEPAVHLPHNPLGVHSSITFFVCEKPSLTLKARLSASLVISFNTYHTVLHLIVYLSVVSTGLIIS